MNVFDNIMLQFGALSRGAIMRDVDTNGSALVEVKPNGTIRHVERTSVNSSGSVPGGDHDGVCPSTIELPFK